MLTRRIAWICVATLSACGGSPTPAASAPSPSDPAVRAIRDAAVPLTGTDSDYDELLRTIGDADVVLLGEQTHGTHEFYAERARITQRLIAEKGFDAVAVEGSWPEAYRVNQFVRGSAADASAEQALSGFTDFPAWLWRNEPTRDLVQWMRTYNMARTAGERVGFYGMDVYSLYPSIDFVLRYLERVNVAAAGRVRTLYACFEASRPDAQAYGARAASGTSCASAAASVLAELQAIRPAAGASVEQREAWFAAARNAHSVINAESYFRSSYTGEANTWNLRDQRMAEGVAALQEHLAAGGGAPAKVVIWAHNTHSGDARATQMGAEGELNIGQLMRQRSAARAVLVGFFTYSGSVYAAPGWGSPGRVYELRPALPESFGAIFHATALPRFSLMLQGGGTAVAPLAQSRLERAVGVIYLPQSERQSHYFMAQLARQFDAVVYLDQTRAITPLR